MATDTLSPIGVSHPFTLGPIQERSLMSFSKLDINATGQTSTLAAEAKDMMPSIVIRHLPFQVNLDVLRGMLLFSKDLMDVNFIDTDTSEDKAYKTAIAHFISLAGANEAKEKLHGKALGGDAPLSVELLGGLNGRRNTIDSMRSGAPSSTSSLSSSANGARQSSRFNGTFQSLDNKFSPPTGADMLPAPQSNMLIPSLFSPQSPLANNTSSSKTLINDDPTDETAKLLNETVSFGKGSDPNHPSMGRRITGPQMLNSRMGGLSLTTSNSTQTLSSPLSGMISPRTINPTTQSITPALSPNPMSPMLSMSGQSNHTFSPQSQHSQFASRAAYPPVNPADQNPPCNTLYVGNLPMDTSEDELKALFSKQRGYKRLCFRTKANGPMCFVEFEDTSFATRALKELYGQPLHNSVKGGIRLSFSKNPLGVRSVQNANNHNMHQMGPSMPSASTSAHSFSTANGPPPGLLPPGYGSAGLPGLGAQGLNGQAHGHGHSHNMNGNMNPGLGVFSSNGFGGGFTGMRQPITSAAGRDYTGHSTGGDFGYMGR